MKGNKGLPWLVVNMVTVKAGKLVSNTLGHWYFLGKSPLSWAWRFPWNKLKEGATYEVMTGSVKPKLKNWTLLRWLSNPNDDTNQPSLYQKLWWNKKGLRVNTSETTILLFRRRKNIAVLSWLIMAGVWLGISRTALYLGIALDQRLISANCDLKPYLPVVSKLCLFLPRYIQSSYLVDHNQPNAYQKLVSPSKDGLFTIIVAFTRTPIVTTAVLLGLLYMDLYLNLDAKKAAYLCRLLDSYVEATLRMPRVDENSKC